MAAKKTVGAYAVLLAICLGLMNWAALGSLFRSRISESRTSVCATHEASCSCPAICAEQKRQTENESCHQSALAQHRQEAGKEGTDSSCSLKAGCGERESLVGSSFFLKDFLPEEPVIVNGSLPISLFTPCRFSTVLPDHFFRFFHPPKIT